MTIENPTIEQIISMIPEQYKQYVDEDKFMFQIIDNDHKHYLGIMLKCITKIEDHELTVNIYVNTACTYLYKKVNYISAHMI